MVKAHIELLGSPTGDSNRSALLFFDDERYLFECGDGTQRLCTEYGVSIATEKLQKILISRMDPTSIGGILGLALTVADSGRKSLNLVGPEGLNHFMEEAKPFFYRPKMGLDILEVDQGDMKAQPVVCKTNYVTIEAVPITSAQTSEQPSERQTVERHRKRARGSPVVCYICKTKDIPGKFDPRKANSLGIPRGPLYGQLTKGKPVTLPSGRIVEPEEVISPATPGPIVLVISCVDENYIETLTGEARLSNIRLNEREDRELCILHFSPRSVVVNEKYRQWVASFGARSTHIFADESLSPMRPVYRDQADAICRRNVLLGEEYAPLPEGFLGGEESTLLAELQPSVPGKLVMGDTLLRFRIAPAASIGLDHSLIPPQRMEFDAIKQQVTTSETAEEQLAFKRSFRPTESAPEYLKGLSERSAELRFLGTAAAMPGKHRNVSGIFFNLFDRGCVLLDCGEGTYGQMVRCMGREAADQAVASLRFVWISHLHADHHLGLLHILHKRISLGAERPLVVVGPAKLRNWLCSYQEMIGGDSSFIFIDGAELLEPQQPIATYFPENFGVTVRCCEVIHCPHAYGIAIEDCVNHWKLCYSGDTRPCKDLIQIGMNSTVVIHEATLEDGMEAEAEEKAHCTTSEALSICSAMNPYRIILTHFSQRYPRVPVIKDKTDPRLSRVAVAFDFMRVNFVNLDRLPSTLPLLLSLYPDEVVSADAN